LASSVAAQQPGRGRGFGFGQVGTNLLTLASIETVQTEIKATDGQKEEIARLLVAQRAEGRGGGRANFQNLSDEERQKLIAELRERATEQAKKAREGLAKTLEPKQLERLEQIAVQAQGIGALTNSEIAGKLKLSTEQVAKLEAISNGSRQAIREAVQGGNAAGAREKLAQLRRESEEKSLAVLSAEQKEQFTALKGEPFELPAGALGGRGGRRNNNDNNN
jgi:hypothetical protein